MLLGPSWFKTLMVIGILRWLLHVKIHAQLCVSATVVNAKRAFRSNHKRTEEPLVRSAGIFMATDDDG